jgi:acyl carrier protein
MNTKRTIREFILSNFIKGGKSKNLVDDISLFDAGIIDSVGLLELIAFLEEKFDFKVEDEEIVPENFDSVNKLVAYVSSKLAPVKA